MAGASGADLGHVLGQLAEGVVVVDASGRLLYANAEAVRIWGYDDSGQVPETWHGFEGRFEVRDAAGEPVPPERWPVALALAGERFDAVEYWFAGPDGAERWARCAGGPLRLEGGRDGAWVSFRDVGREETILRSCATSGIWSPPSST